MPLCFHLYFLPFYSLWFNLNSFYCCVLLPSSFILQCLVSCVINLDDCSFQYYIFQFQKSHLFIFLSFSPCLFLCFIKHIDIRGSRSSSVNSIISVICEAALNACFKKMCYGLHFSFGNSNNILVGCWASLSSPLPGRTSEVNNQNTPRNQAIVLDELNKVVSLGYLHSVQMCSFNDQMMNSYFGFPPLVSKLP